MTTSDLKPCRLWRPHTWTKWVEVKRGQYKLQDNVKGVAIQQERVCERCGKIEARMEVATI